jgi:hypothetical protein
MNKKAIIDDDLVEVKYKNFKGEGWSLVLAWGDPIEILAEDRTKTRVSLDVAGRTVEGTVRGKIKTRPNGVLQFSLLDVQQGDGMVLQTPLGKVMLTDGGYNQLFARYLAARFRNNTDVEGFVNRTFLIPKEDFSPPSGPTPTPSQKYPPRAFT